MALVTRSSAKHAGAGNVCSPLLYPATLIQATSTSPSSPASITTYQNRATPIISGRSWKNGCDGINARLSARTNSRLGVNAATPRFLRRLFRVLGYDDSGKLHHFLRRLTVLAQRGFVG